MSILGRFTVNAWRNIDREWTQAPDAERYDWRPLFALVAVGFALTGWYYYGTIEAFVLHFPKRWATSTGSMASLRWTAGVHVVALIIVPMLIVAMMPGERIRDYLSAAGRVARRTWLYLFVIALGLPGLLLLTHSFDTLAFYPFEIFDQLAPVDKATWLALVAVQILCVEFFFCCFLLRAIAPRFGSAAIFAMIVPYSMMLYGKPVKEFMGALILTTLYSTYLLHDPALLRGPARALEATGKAKHRFGAIGRWIRTLTVDSWRHIDKEWIVDHKDKPFDWRPLIVLGTVAISLMLQENYGDRGTFAEYFPERMASKYGVLQSFAWWSGWRFFGYVILPVLAIMLMPGERIRDYFIGFKNFIKHLWIYLGLFALVLPAVLIASQTDSFLKTYPFYKLANRSAFDFWAWQALYSVQFLSLEFFFRGFILKATAPRLGSGAIFVMIVPYCMIHFGKPMAETLAAMLAGTVLGTLALRTRSIWGGVLIHVGVALTMDLLAVSHCPPADSGLQCPRH